LERLAADRDGADPEGRAAAEPATPTWTTRIWLKAILKKFDRGEKAGDGHT
jgi:hypothetical protein